ncbi:MAG: efflux transporter outer membrane subunit [Bacteroidetes bacterium]|nr:efflux transporter outer membrane subunit [Bacteroidota bacterium]
MKTTYNLFLFGLFILVAGCKSLKNPIEPNLKKIPINYLEISDSVNSAKVTPKELFSDSLLHKLIDSALTSNLALLRAQNNLLQFEADIQEARSNLIPKVGVFGGYSKRKFGLHTMDGAGNITTPIGDGELIPIHLNDFNFGLQTSWEIDIWGKLKQQKKAAQSRLLAAIETQNMLKTQIIEQVVLNYFNLVCLDENKRIVNRNLLLNQEMIEVLKAQKESGKTTELSVQQFESLSLNYANEILKLDAEIYYTENELRKLCGKFDGVIERSSFQSNKLQSIQINSGIPGQLLSNRPDVRQAEQELLASKADLLTARKMFYPSLTINGSLGYQAYKTRFLFASPESIAYGLFGNLMAPIINLGELKANFKRASSNQIDALYNCQETLLNAFTEVNNSLFAIQNTEKMISNKNREMEKLKESRTIAGELFNANRADYLEVLFSQQNALSAELELMDLSKNQFLWKVYLYKAIGGGWR